MNKSELKRADREFQAKLKLVRKDIFDCAFDPDICDFATVSDLAKEAGLSWQTVDKMYRGLTKQPRFSTIVKLCKAIKMDIDLVKEELKHTLSMTE